MLAAEAESPDGTKCNDADTAPAVVLASVTLLRIAYLLAGQV